MRGRGCVLSTLPTSLDSTEHGHGSSESIVDGGFYIRAGGLGEGRGVCFSFFVPVHSLG